ncbi:MAG: hypothetical protein RL322_2436 [Pseudomonadota bacterium]|jgi:hypothetical protein
MFANLVPVTRERHATQRIRPVERFEFARQFHVASLMMHEFVRATAFYPIVFIEEGDRSAFKPVALLGLEASENLCVDAESAAWLPGAYIPGIIRRYPFALASTAVQGEFAICVDEGANLLSDAEGMPLFNGEGAATETLEHVKRFLGELQQMDTITQAFCDWVVRHDLLKPLNLRVRVGSDTRDIAGSHVINEERLDALSDQTFLEMRRLRYLGPIHAHLTSLAQIDRLVRLKETRAGIAGSANDSASRPRGARKTTGRPRSPRKA